VINPTIENLLSIIKYILNDFTAAQLFYNSADDENSLMTYLIVFKIILLLLKIVMTNGFFLIVLWTLLY